MDIQIADAGNMNAHAFSEVRAAKVSIHSDSAVTLAIRGLYLLPRSEVLHAVNEKIRMRVAEDQWAKFHDTDKAGKIQNFRVRITTVENTRQIEEFCALIYLRPETLFECLLGHFEGVCLLDKIKVRENAYDLGKAVGLQNV